jgi:hypothetical protein
MAIAPNTTFSSGAILTAAQMNALPFGIVAYSQSIVNETFTVEEVTLSVTFTAIANRYYEITYFEPKVFTSAGSNECEMKIRLTNLAGAIQQNAFANGSSSIALAGIATVVKTFSAGSVTLVSTILTSGGTGSAARSATQIGFLVVKDIGPS